MNRTAFIVSLLTLSIATIPVAVKAENKSHSEGELKDSVREEQSGFSKLVQTLMDNGSDWEYRNGFAQVVGLDGPMPAKVTLSVVNGKGYKCHVIYANDGTSNRPLCVYLIETTKTKKSIEERFFRVSLDGHLEKAVVLKGEYDENGQTIRDRRSKEDQDVESPAVQKAFKHDMTYWVKDWLRKQEKTLGKKGKTEASAATTPAK